VAELVKGAANINQALVAAGAAFVYWQYIEGCDLETYSLLETQARLRSLGVWPVMKVLNGYGLVSFIHHYSSE